MHAYIVSTDILDYYVTMGERIIIKSLKHFVKFVVYIFGDDYLRASNAQETARLMTMNNVRRFSCMLGCIDCMYWIWDK
jgi:hypothetical protein